MADNKVVLEFEVKGNGEQKAQSLRAQMKALRDELGRLPEGTKEFDEIQRQLGELTDKVGDLNRSVNTLAGDPLERLNNSFGMIGSSLMSLDFGGAVTGLNGVSGAISEIKFKDVAKGVEDVGGAFAKLGKALLTNPIFLLAATIALVAMNFDKLIKLFPSLDQALTGLNDSERALAASTEARAAASQKAYETIKKQDNILKLQGLTEKEILERKIKSVAISIQDRKAQLINAQEQAKIQIETAKRNRQILDGMLHFVTGPIEVIVGMVDLIGNAFGQKFNIREQMMDAIGDLLLDSDEQEKKLNEDIEKSKDALLTMEEEFAGYQLSIQAMDKKTSENKNSLAQNDHKTQKELQEKELKQKEDLAQKELDAAKKQKDLLKQIEEEALTEREALAQEIQNIRQGAEATEIQNLRDSYFTKIAIAEKEGLDFLALEEKLAQEEQAIREKYAVKEVELVKMTTEQKMQLAQTGLNGLMNLNDLLTASGLLNAKQSFKINKALQLTQAGIGAVQAVQNVLADPTLIGGTRFIAAAAAGVAGAANVAKIAAMKFNPGSASSPSGGGGGSMGAVGNGGGGSTSAPALDLSFLNNQQTKAQPIQSYVLATNVTSAQDAQQKILDQSKLIK
jgi:hypothetical protein